MTEDCLAGRFEIQTSVASGGMGDVFRGLDRQTNRTVAIKIIRHHDAIEIERARREAQILQRLDHAGIVAHVADGITDSGALFIAMEWVDGMTASERLLGEGFTLAEAVAVARQVARALAIAHAAGVLHRDIKPSNVLLVGGDPARVKLIDFGVARIDEALSALTRTGTTIGTPGYMAPEQARGQRTLTPAADIFGLGCLLYECATGKPAFSGTIAAAVLAKILVTSPIPFGDACPEAPDWLCALVDRMLAKDVAKRIARCTEIADALDRAIPAGPRRTNRSANAATAPSVPAASNRACFVVMASRSRPEDIAAPPDEPQARALEQLDDCEICANGSVVAHVEGDRRDAAERAAACALAMRAVLDGWTIVVSAPQADRASAIDEGTALLGEAAMTAMFRPREYRGAIVIDARVAPLVEHGFEIDRPPRGEPRLLGKRAV